MAQSIKLLHIIGGGEFGGAEQHILSLMKLYPHYSIDATVLTFYDSIFAQKLREQNYKVITLHTYNRYDFRLYTALCRVIQEIQPDIIHTHGVRANFFGRRAAQLGEHHIVVTTIHSILRHDYPTTFRYVIAHLMERTTQRLTDHFIAVSDAIKEQLLRDRVSTDRITVIQNGIDVHSYSANDHRLERAHQLRNEFGIPKDRLIVGTNARLVPVKGLPYLIHGFAKALQQDRSLHLFIAGDGPDREQLEQLIRQVQIEDHVSLVGFRHDVADCLAMIDVYVNCSLSEGTPVSVMEAMAAAKPLILTNVGGMKEMAEHERSAIFIPPQSDDAIASSILRLKHDEPLRERLGQAAYNTVKERYSIEGMAQQQIRIYEQLLKGSL